MGDPTAVGAMTDLVVVVPGLGGSVLATATGTPVWGGGLGTVAKAALRPRHFLERLALPTDPGDGPAGDGVVPVGLLDVPAIVPAFANLDGYRDLVDHLAKLQRPLGLAPLAFAYDWRLSVMHNATLLHAAVTEALDRRRQQLPDSRTFIVAHSMGGLVARCYLEALDGAERCRTLVTLGTPYRGAVKAVGVFTGSSGPLADVTRGVARTWPGARQLLPSGAVVRAGDGFVTAADAGAVGDIPARWFDDAARIHGAASPHPRGTSSAYRCVALVGTFQATPLFVERTVNGIVIHRTLAGQPTLGDGTVSHGSARPPEWTDQADIAVGPFHAKLQSDPVAHQQLASLLATGDPAQLMGDADQRIGVDVDDVVAAGAPIAVGVSCAGTPDLVVTVRDATRPDAAPVVGALTLYRDGDDRYSTTVAPLAPGAYDITVASRPGTVDYGSATALVGVVADG